MGKRVVLVRHASEPADGQILAGQTRPVFGTLLRRPA